MCYNRFILSAPVVELDTIRASDAPGPSSSLGGRTKRKKPLAGFFWFDIVSARIEQFAPPF